jgi:hypothetical protein
MAPFFRLKRAGCSCEACCWTAKSRAIKCSLVATLGIDEENLLFDDLPRDRGKVLSVRKTFAFYSILLSMEAKRHSPQNQVSIQQPYPDG